MKTMKQKLQIHREIERMDREHRTWYQNTMILDQLTDTFPIGSLVQNFGVEAMVDGYEARNLAYTGDLILLDPASGMRWVGRTEYCKALA